MSELEITNTSFQQFLQQQKLMATRCLNCDSLFLPPRSHCASCHGERLEWVEMSGRGELVAFSIIHIGLTRMIAAGYDRKNPYCTGIVKLVEGPSISAEILNVDTLNPETIRAGMPLQAEYISRGEGEEQRTYLAFAPV